MKTHCTNLSIVMAVALVMGPVTIPAAAAERENRATQDIEGIWSGAVEIPGEDVPPIIFRIIRNLDGQLNAYVESPDQVHRIRASRVTFTSGNLRLDVEEIGGVFEGKAAADNLTIEGKWTQAGQSFPLVAKRAKEQARPNRPQEPKRPYPYDEEEVVYENKAAGVKLSGTLTLPRMKGPLPAVRLVGGSGALNRDDDCSGHRTLLVLADYLTRRGLAVLRVDKRGVWKSGGDYDTATTKDFASDVKASIAYLSSHKDVDASKIGLIGHSEGAMIATMLAAECPDIAFIVLMAGAGVPLDKLLVTQKCLYAKADGASDDKIAVLRKWYERFYAVAVEEKDDQAAKNKIRRMYNELADGEKQALGWSEAKLNDEIKSVLGPWWRYLLAFDPRAFLTKVKCPVLAIIGQKDLQVAPNENLRGIERALKEAGNRHYVVRELPSLNHMLQTADTGAESEYAQIEETIAPIALEMMANWILKQVGERQ